MCQSRPRVGSPLQRHCRRAAERKVGARAGGFALRRLLMALSGHRDRAQRCPLLGVKRTFTQTLLTQSGHRNLLARTLHNGPEIVIYVPEFGFGTHRVFADLLLFWHASKLA